MQLQLHHIGDAWRAFIVTCSDTTPKEGRHPSRHQTFSQNAFRSSANLPVFAAAMCRHVKKEMFGLLGPNGAGKSTIIGCYALDKTDQCPHRKGFASSNKQESQTTHRLVSEK
jgi:ATPase subunit of ABC transporter with duplicated ATPase domains